MDDALLSPLLEKLARHHLIPGAQLAVHRDGRTSSVEFGREEHASGRVMNAAAKVPIGSVTKSFTAALAMVLVSDGDLELDEPIAELVPAATRLGDELTLRHLLSHTGGLVSEVPGDPDRTIRRYAADACLLTEPMNAPGALFSYSNTGYVLAGRLIELATGMTWWDAMSSVLLRPLGIEPRYVAGPDGADGHAPGHSVSLTTARVLPVRQSLGLGLAPAGALAASALDLVAFGRFLVGDGPELADRHALACLREPVAGAVPFGLADGWGLGVALFDGGWAGHDGNGDGTSCHLRVHPETGTVVALTTNGNTGFAMWRDLARELHIGDYDGLRQLGKPLEPSSEFLGRFRNGDTEYSVTPGSDTPFRLTADDEPFGDLTLHDDLVFSIRETDTGETAQTGRFVRDQNAEISWLQVGGRLARRHTAA